MSESWRTVTIGDLAEVFDGPHATPTKTERGPWYLSISSLVNGKLDITQSAHLSEDDFPRWTKRVQPQPGDTLFSYETRLGEAAHWSSTQPAALGRRMGLLRPRTDKVDPRFLTYAYLGPQFQTEISRRAIHGATVDRIPIAELGWWPIRVPPLEEQRRITGVLGALDDLIDTNRQEADRLDALCRTLGRQFLIAIADRPLARIDELATVSKGYSYKSTELKEGNGWLVNLKNVGRDGRYQLEGLKPLTGNHKPLHVVETGDICVAQTDLTQKREVIGRPVRVRRGTATGELVASLDLLVVRPGSNSTREYLYAVLDSDAFRSHALGFCNGTTVLHMASAAVPSFEACVPGQDELHRFSERVRVLRDAADRALVDAERLEHTRAELLTLLLSGRVRVEETAA